MRRRKKLMASSICRVILFVASSSCWMHVSASSSTSSSSSSTTAGSGPRFLDKFSDQTLDPGPSVSLKCIASGQPLPQVTWQVNGSPVPDNSRFRTGDYVTRDLLVVSYVNISTTMTQDGGVYVSVSRPPATACVIPHKQTGQWETRDTNSLSCHSVPHLCPLLINENEFIHETILFLSHVSLCSDGIVVGVWLAANPSISCLVHHLLDPESRNMDHHVTRRNRNALRAMGSHRSDIRGN